MRTEADRAFNALTHRISLQIFKINSNVTGISKLVSLLGTPKDTPAIRKKLCVLLPLFLPLRLAHLLVQRQSD